MRIVLTAFLVLLVFSTDAFSQCACRMEQRTLLNEVERAGEVFVGEILSVHKLSSQKDDKKGVKIEISVSETMEKRHASKGNCIRSLK